jgi:hypothetical protein
MVNDHTGEALPLLGVGIVGWGWMGRVHARAYARQRQHYPEAPLKPTLVAVADNAVDDRLAARSTPSASAMRMRIGEIWSREMTSTW